MKTNYCFLSFFVLAFLLVSCSFAPTISEVQEMSKEGVEELLTEDNNDNLSCRLDRYFLDEQVDELTFKGHLKATAFYPSVTWDRRRAKMVDIQDSTKLYRTVIIKFLDKKYNQYSITIKNEDD